MYAGTGEITRGCADQMLLAALQEAQTVVRSYDTKAQIVGVGYILALNLVLHFRQSPADTCPNRPAVHRSRLGYRNPAYPAVLAMSSIQAGRARRRNSSRKNILLL